MGNGSVLVLAWQKMADTVKRCGQRGASVECEKVRKRVVLSSQTLHADGWRVSMTKYIVFLCLLTPLRTHDGLIR